MAQGVAFVLCGTSIEAMFDLNALNVLITGVGVWKFFKLIDYLEGVPVAFEQQKIVDRFTELFHVNRKSLSMLAHALTFGRVA